jgi:transcriptional regulator with XRE-family HTH domain
MAEKFDALGDTLATLRKRARLSQRELSRASDISYTQIGDLERGQGGNPSPFTLRALAKGLASDAFLEQGYDPTRADAFYRQLMGAANYLGGLPMDLPARRTTSEDIVDWIARQTGDSAVAELLVSLAQAYAELGPEDQMVMKHLAGEWIKKSA